jgi:hypothetical protein
MGAATNTSPKTASRKTGWQFKEKNRNKTMQQMELSSISDLRH